MNFFNKIIISGKDLFENDDDYTDSLTPGPIFNRIFQVLDTSNNGKVSRDEILDYFFLLTASQDTVGTAKIGDSDLKAY